ncbi:MAG TPA: class I SAM-dependent methyltransferase [Bryobacteraceae bacterium]|nr:class I SAM-dependent methyltransferase [Bryobacteraceae bacterium]HUI81089.1 class I SAM-dependent methyltransferase [Bryobacteraceae bacterium]
MLQQKTRPTTRSESFGQDYRLTAVDRFGIWLSARKLRRFARYAGNRVGDFGCGYQASFARTVLNEAAHITLIDVSLAPDLKEHPKIAAIEGGLPESLRLLANESLDVILCVSVLEHLWEPLRALVEFRRILAPGGVCLLNVPSWRGKRFLEFSAFRLGLSPRAEMDDHKMYYDVRDFWPLLVQAGFRPSGIRCFPHKFGLNTFAVCKAE